MSNALRRVLMTGDTVGGVWTFTVELGAALGKSNVEVVLAALGGMPSEAQLAEVSDIPNLTLVASDWKLEWMPEPWSDVEQSGQWLLELERQYGPDVVHLNSFGHGALPWRAPVVLTAHSCVSSWWEAVKHEPLPESWSRYRALVFRSLEAADVIIAPTHAMLRALGDHYGTDVESKNCRVIANARRRALFHPAPKQPFFLAAGRLWDEGKNIAAVAAAAPQLPWPVYLAGEQRSPEGSRCEAECCRILGRLSTLELASWYARAAIYMLPARYEPFGLSVLEAALSGCALVLGDIPSLRELWNGAAVFVPPEDPAALAEACRELIDNPEKREALTQSSLAAARRFTPERMAEGYLSAYAFAIEESYACAS